MKPFKTWLDALRKLQSSLPKTDEENFNRTS